MRSKCTLTPDMCVVYGPKLNDKQGKRMKILVIEDDADLREIIVRSLERNVMWWRRLPTVPLRE